MEFKISFFGQDSFSPKGLHLKNGRAIILFVERECWNWQTGKTKDLVGVCSCGFKSHLPHEWAKAPDEDFVKGEDLL